MRRSIRSRGTAQRLGRQRRRTPADARGRAAVPRQGEVDVHAGDPISHGARPVGRLRADTLRGYLTVSRLGLPAAGRRHDRQPGRRTSGMGTQRGGVERSSVRIGHVEAYRVRVPAPSPPFGWRRGLLGGPAGGEGGVLRIATDDGLEGVALVPRRGAGAVLEALVSDVLRDELVGTDALQREWLWHRMWEIDRTEELAIYILGVVDTALWDLAGRAVGRPVWQLLGGFRDAIAAYASTATFATTQEYLAVASQCLALGYPAIKLHAWGDAREDAALCLALREHVGDEVVLMYDGSAGFDLPDAVYLGHALDDAGYLWYEEPIREFNVTAYKWLAERVRVPLCVAETSDGAHMNTADFIAAGAASFVRTSAELRGGITGAMRIAHLADAFRLRAEVHGPGLNSQHLCMAIANTTYYESLVTATAVSRDPVVDEQGLVHAPQTAGIGLPPGPEYPSALEHLVDTVAPAPTDP